MLRRTSTGFGMLALSALMADPAYAGLVPAPPENPLAPKPGHHQPRVRNVIFCYLSGGLSHVDSFDPKPRLDKEAGEPMPFKTERTMFNMDGNIMPSPWKFKRYGSSGIPVSDLFPHIGSVADELTVIRSMTAKFMAHAQANFYFHSGTPFAGFPSMGAWISYGLGSENRNLPGFVVLGSGGIPLGGISIFGNGFLSAVHQGSFIFPERQDPLGNIRPREPGPLQRRKISFINDLDREFLAGTAGHSQVEAAIRNYETAYRMQSSVPELVDLSGETLVTRRLYGIDSANPAKAAYARQCLVARRLVERGVRFVELTMVRGDGQGGMSNPWDQHAKLVHGHGSNALAVDQPIAALVKDLKARGLLDETLVIFSGRVRPDAFRPGKGRPGPQSLRLQPLAGRRRPQEGFRLRRHRRVRLPRGGEPADHPRSPRHHPPPHGSRSPSAQLPLRRPGLSSHRRPRTRDPGHSGLLGAETVLSPSGGASYRRPLLFFIGSRPGEVREGFSSACIYTV